MVNTYAIHNFIYQHLKKHPYGIKQRTSIILIPQGLNVNGGCRPTAKTRNRSTSLARSELKKMLATDEVTTVAELASPFGSTDYTYIKLIRGGLCPPLSKKKMLRALSLKPTKGSAFGNCEPLKNSSETFHNFLS